MKAYASSLSLMIGLSRTTSWFSTKVERIQTEENLAARGEILSQIAQEKIPFRCPPAFLRRMIKVEVGRKGRDPIKFLAKVRQWFERADPPNYAGNFQKLE